MNEEKQIEELITTLNGILKDQFGFVPLEKTINVANALIAADYRKQNEGEWRLIQTEGFGDGSYYSKFFCSLCYREVGVCHEHEKDKHKNAKALYPYCHCGAKMKGGE